MSFYDFTGTLRVSQWVKNLFVFLPAFFGQQLNVDNALMLSLTFVSFSLAASSVYILNDVVDIEFDRQHPKKRNRPIASGKLNKQTAYMFSLTLIFACLAIAYWVHALVLLACILYISQNMLYSFWLKRLALVDITIIALGFLIRLYAGGIVAAVPVSNWMYIMTFLLALLLALGKRRDDLLILEHSGKKLRGSTDGYSIKFIDHLSVMLSGVIIVSYVMYTLTPDIIRRAGSDYVFVTSIFVFLGVLRYLQLELVKQESGYPTLILLKDFPTRVIVLAWISTFGYLLYF